MQGSVLSSLLRISVAPEPLAGPRHPQPVIVLGGQHPLVGQIRQQRPPVKRRRLRQRRRIAAGEQLIEPLHVDVARQVGGDPGADPVSDQISGAVHALQSVPQGEQRDPQRRPRPGVGRSGQNRPASRTRGCGPG